MEGATRRLDARKRVLIADDDDDVCSLFEAVLAPMVDLTVVHDAEAALELLQTAKPYDAIVSDFMLPGITGLEFVKRVRGGERDAHVPILMISGHGALGVGAAARAAGADAFLDKPFTLAQLRASVSSLLAPRLRLA